MKNKLLGILFFLTASSGALRADNFVNLTPKPAAMTVGSGALALPATLVVSTNGLPDSLVAEARTFADFYALQTGGRVELASSDGLIKMEEASSLLSEKEGYNLDVTATGVTLQARTAAGFFYGFQSILKMLDGNALPVVSIRDAPRFGYRGFMLDVARHFFSVNEIERLLRLMARYKMNRFHWHLTDDQGWRIEIKKYPRLTTVGSIAPNCYVTDMRHGAYWTNRPYGPYYYTQDEIRRIVAYARSLHIEIIPEIDMPGHFVAALAAYPEFSCSPSATHTVWSSGGISTDVLNVGNPRAVQFAKDILEEVMALFPFEQINIGGDECPTSAWESNGECRALYAKLGLTHYRRLQSHFIKEMADFIAEKGRKTAVWNEAITAQGADTSLIRRAGATVFCWNPSAASARMAAEMGLDNVVTAYGPYYINRKQSTAADEPSGAGYGADSLRATYGYVPVPTGLSTAVAQRYIGVQGSFWSEHVADTAYLEYLALPRLFAIAEAGWTAENRKNYADFVRRIAADTTFLNTHGYNYCRRDLTKDQPVSMVFPKTSTTAERHYYRLVTKATDAARAGRCMELLAAGSPLLTTYVAKGAAVGVLWTNAPADTAAANHDAQLWAFEESPTRKGYFALVNKTLPEGSVNASPTVVGTTGRWRYDTEKHYDFILGDGGYGVEGDSRYYTLRSSRVAGWYMNHSMSGQGFALNLWRDAADGNGGLWTFVSTDASAPRPVEGALQVGKTYRIFNAVAGFDGTALVDAADAYLHHSAEAYAADAWTVAAASVSADSIQSVVLKNAMTGRYVGAPAATAHGSAAYPVSVGTSGGRVALHYDKSADEYALSLGGKHLFPLPVAAALSGGIVSSGTTVGTVKNAVRPQGAAWRMMEVRPLVVRCTDEAGAVFATLYCSFPVAQEYAFTPPTLPARTALSFTLKKNASGADTATVVYRRTAYTVRTVCRTQNGALLADRSELRPAGERFVPAYPVFEHFTLESASPTAPVELVSDTLLTAFYSTEAYLGVERPAAPATRLTDGHSYLLYDTSPADAARVGFRSVDPSGLRVLQADRADDATPYFVWTIAKTGGAYTVKNEYAGAYVPELAQSQPIYLGAVAGRFTFTPNADGTTWKIQGSNGQYWDGVVGGLTGWHTYGHAYKVYEYFARPFYAVTLRCETADGTLLGTRTDLVRAGEAYTLALPAYEAHLFRRLDNAESLAAVRAHTVVRAVYETATGLSSTLLPSSASAIYDLAGRRVTKAAKGIYIVDGRKVWVK